MASCYCPVSGKKRIPGSTSVPETGSNHEGCAFSRTAASHGSERHLLRRSGRRPCSLIPCFPRHSRNGCGRHSLQLDPVARHRPRCARSGRSQIGGDHERAYSHPGTPEVSSSPGRCGSYLLSHRWDSNCLGNFIRGSRTSDRAGIGGIRGWHRIRRLDTAHSRHGHAAGILGEVSRGQVRGRRDWRKHREFPSSQERRLESGYCQRHGCGNAERLAWPQPGAWRGALPGDSHPDGLRPHHRASDREEGRRHRDIRRHQGEAGRTRFEPPDIGAPRAVLEKPGRQLDRRCRGGAPVLTRSVPLPGGRPDRCCARLDSRNQAGRHHRGIHERKRGGLGSGGQGRSRGSRPHGLRLRAGLAALSRLSRTTDRALPCPLSLRGRTCRTRRPT